MGTNPSDGQFGRQIPFTSTAILITDSSGDYRVLGSGAPLPVTVGDGVGIDAFNRMRVSSPAAVFDSKQIYDSQPLYWDVLTSGGATSTHYPNLAATRLLLPANTAGTSAIRQTKEYFNYQPGRSQLVQITGKMGHSSNVTYRVGLFDANNGLFFEQANGAKRVVIRGFMTGSAADTQIGQDDWNVDKLDGTGESGITIDWTKVQIWVIDFQWLGVGRVRFGMVIGGMLFYCHEHKVANVGENVYMSTPNLPVRYEVAATSGGPTSNAAFDTICVAVFSEGGADPRGNIASYGMTSSRTAANGTRTPLLAIQLKSGNIRSQIRVDQIDILSGLNPIYWELILNPTLTSPSWVSVNANSIANRDIAGTGGTGGFVMASGFIPSQTRGASAEIQTALKLVADILGTSDTVLLAATGIGGTSACYGAMTWKEIT